MTGLLRLCLKTTWTLKGDPYRQRNNIHKQIVRKPNRKGQDKLLQNNNILFQVKRTNETYE